MTDPDYFVLKFTAGWGGIAIISQRGFYDMTSYARAELEEAKTSLTSTLHISEKIDEGKKPGKSQQTLLGRILFDG